MTESAAPPSKPRGARRWPWLVLAAALLLMAYVASYAALRWLDPSAWPPHVPDAVAIFGACNLILTAINYLPAIPFDGGLILQAFLGRSLGADRALRVATDVSLALLSSMAALGAWLFQPVLIYLAATIAYDNWRKHLRASAPGETAARDMG